MKGVWQVRIGLTAGTFDLFHAGHVLMLEEAKQQSDHLIVALQTDPTLDRPEKNKPIQTVVERCIQLRGCKFVDEIIPYITEKDLEDILLSLPIDVRILGIEYKDKEFTGQEFCKSRGIEFYFNKRDHKFSSSELRKRMVKKHIKSRVNKLCRGEEGENDGDLY